MRWALVFLLVSVLLSQVLAQDSTEDSPAPKRVLKKYRVRRPVVVDDQGNVVRAGPRLRRVRVKQPRPTIETAALQGNPPQAVSVSVSTRQSQSSQPIVLSTNPPRLRPTQRAEQPTAPAPIAQTTQQPRVLQVQHHSKLRQLQPEQVYLDDNVPQVIEQVRTVPTYRQATPSANRQALLANVNYKSRGVQSLEEEDDEDRTKVGTIRNYSHINEDGSFTFGYEAADGSFKEETRGIDCVVRGKYGYVDPDGVRREFEYVSGNPCDPNAPKEDDTQEEEEEEDERAAPPPRPLLRRVRPELSENQLQGLQQVREETLSQDQLNQYVRPVPRQRILRPTAQPVTGRPRIRITTAPPTLSPQTESPALIIRERPVSRPLYYHQDPNQSLESDRGSRLFHFDNEVQRLSQISRPISQPQPLYEQPLQVVQRHPSPTVATQPATQYFGNLRNFPTGRSAAPTAPSPTLKSINAGPNSVTASPEKNPQFGRYRTELVYDPSTGHYTSVVVQAMPNSNQEIELTQRLRAFVEPQKSNQFQIQNFGQPQQLQYYNNPSAQSASGQIDQFLSRNAYSQQRLNEQQQQQQQQPRPQQHTFQYYPHQQPSPSSPPPQQEAAPVVQQPHQQQQQQYTQNQFHYPQTQNLDDHSRNPANGQIDAFLRSLNIAI